MKRTARVVSVIAVCASVGLAACGSDSGLVADEASATISDENTTDAGDEAEVTRGEAVAKLRTALDSQDSEASMSFDLVVDVSSGDFSESFTTTGQVDPVSMSAATVLDLPAEGDQPVGTLETRVIDGVAYLTGEQFTAGFGVDTAWVSFAADELASAQQLLIPGIDASDPTAVLSIPPIDGAEVAEDGTGTVAGVEVTNYTVSLDPAVLGDAPGVGQLAEQLVDGNLDFVLSIDADGQLRRLTLDEEIAIPGGTTADIPSEIGLSLSMTVTEYGANVNIEAPADADVTDVTDQIAGG